MLLTLKQEMLRTLNPKAYNLTLLHGSVPRL